MHFKDNERNIRLLSIFPALLQISISTYAGIKIQITGLYLKRAPEICQLFLAEAQPKENITDSENKLE